MGAISTILNILLFAVFGILAVMVIWMFASKLKPKKGGSAGTSQKQKGASEKQASLRDTREFLSDLEDMRDGIVITDKGRRFVTAIMVNGVSDFYSQSVSEQLGVMYGYRGFVNLYKDLETYSIYAKEIDIDAILKRYEDKGTEIRAALEAVEEEIRLFPGGPEDLDKLNKEKELYERRLRHISEELSAMEFYSSAGVVREETQAYIFDYVFDSSEYQEDLSENEIFMRAKQELETRARAKIDALTQAGCAARMCTQSEMMDMFRRLSRPVSVDLYKQKNIEESSFFDDIVSSESERKMKEFAKTEIQEETSGGFENIFFPVKDTEEDEDLLFLFNDEEEQEEQVSEIPSAEVDDKKEEQKGSLIRKKKNDKNDREGGPEDGTGQRQKSKEGRE